MSSPSRSEQAGSAAPGAAAPRQIELDAPLPATWVLVGVLVWVHLATAAVAWKAGADPADVLLYARSDRVRTLVGGQEAERVGAGAAWRLATSVLLHVDALHLVLNVLALGALGRILEPWVGSLRLVSWFALGGLGGSVCSQLSGVARSDGASGGAFALLGAALVLGWRWRSHLDRVDRRVVGPVLGGLLGLNLVLSVAVPAIDVAGHLGGLLVGVAVGWIPPRRMRVAEVSVVAGFAAACAYGWLFGASPG